MKKYSVIITIAIIVIILIVVNAVNKAPDSEAYALMNNIAKSLGVDIELEPTTVGWGIGHYQTIDGKMMKLYRPGYEFIDEHTAAENEKIGATWNETKTVDPADVAARFEAELRARGFTLNPNNTGDATFYGSVGYVKDSIGCVIFREVLVDDPAEIEVGKSYPSKAVIKCSDNILWENNAASATTTPATTTGAGEIQG